MPGSGHYRNSLLEFESRMVVTKDLLERKESQGWLPRSQIESFRHSVSWRGMSDKDNNSTSLKIAIAWNLKFYDKELLIVSRDLCLP